MSAVASPRHGPCDIGNLPIVDCMTRPLKILLAEDEKAVAFSVKFALESQGHSVSTVSDGEQAFARISANSEAVDLLITDNNMPRMTGLELVRRLRAAAFSGKILILSAHLSHQNRAIYHALGVDGMISKPFDVHALRKTVSDLAESSV